jgi:hypothetical protein
MTILRPSIAMLRTSAATCRLLSSSQTIATGFANGQVVLFDSEITDFGGWFDPAAPGRFTVPQGVGAVLLSGAVRWQAEAAPAGDRRLRFFQNGVEIAAGGVMRRPVASLSSTTPDLGFASPMMTCVSGDYFELEASHTQGDDTQVEANSATWFGIIGFSGVA